jgi:hypothetical protein
LVFCSFDGIIAVNQKLKIGQLKNYILGTLFIYLIFMGQKRGFVTYNFMKGTADKRIVLWQFECKRPFFLVLS